MTSTTSSKDVVVKDYLNNANNNEVAAPPQPAEDLEQLDRGTGVIRRQSSLHLNDG